MTDFAAIDFETANGEPTSVCSVGIVIVRNGEIVNQYYSLIRPEPNYYAWFCQRVHGLSNKDTCKARCFSDVWAEIVPMLEISEEDQQLIGCTTLPLVAHNARFDEGCLKAVFRCYQMDYPDYHFYCTLKASRRTFKDIENHQLHTVARQCGYDLKNHHHALADAEACAWIAREIL